MRYSELMLRREIGHLWLIINTRPQYGTSLNKSEVEGLVTYIEDLESALKLVKDSPHETD